MRVMMSAAGSPVAPGIIRHLQKLGHFTMGHDCLPYGYGPAILDDFYVSPPIAEQPQEYLDFLTRRDCDVYLPFLDEELRLPDFNVVAGINFISPARTLDTFTSKIKQQYAFEFARLPVAPYVTMGDMIAKPEYGRGGKGHIRTSDPNVANALFDAGYLVQRFIEGDEYTIDVLTDLNGAFLCAVPRLRIQANGVSIIGKIVLDEQDLISLACQVVDKFEFRGPINIQVIRQKTTGKLFIVEVNPRLSGSCMFTVMAGFDILDATIRLFEGKPFIMPKEVRPITIRRHYEESVI